MNRFTAAHEEQLRNYLEGFGLKSDLGPKLARLENAYTVPLPKFGAGEYMPVKRQNENATRDFHSPEALMEAARLSRRIGQILESMGRQDRRVLCAAYCPVPRDFGRSPVLDVLFGDEARDVVRQSRAEDREEKRAGKKALASMEHQARTALELAQEAYVVACDAVAAVEREERQGRFAAGLM